MSDQQSSLYDMNWAALADRYPEVARSLPAASQTISIHERNDGYFYATYRDSEQSYTVARDEDIVADLRGFRKEISNALSSGIDLIFLMGIGLGYRACAAFDMLQNYACGLVIIEESPEWIVTACQCSNLQPIFYSDRVDLLASRNLQNDLRKHIDQKEWYGARKSAFFSGGQSRDYAQQDYSNLITFINKQNQELQNEFFIRWQNWFQSRVNSNKKKETVLIVYEQQERHSAGHDKLLSVKNNLDDGLICVELPINGHGFVPLTLILNRVIECRADAVYCLGFKPVKWIAEDALKAMPIEVKEL